MKRLRNRYLWQQCGNVCRCKTIDSVPPSLTFKYLGGAVPNEIGVIKDLRVDVRDNLDSAPVVKKEWPYPADQSMTHSIWASQNNPMVGNQRSPDVSHH